MDLFRKFVDTLTTRPTIIQADKIDDVDMDPDARTLPLGGKLENVRVKLYEPNLWGMYTVEHLADGSYRFTKKKPVGGKRNKSRKVRRNRKRYSRKH
jgi:hypothetical protein